MIHELLFALSTGSPSPLLSSSTEKASNGYTSLHTLLSPAEQALLKSLAQNLGNRNKIIRDNALELSSTHPSTICRAVSTAIVSTHLTSFRRKVLEVEKDILEKSANIVGALNIVPLSAIVKAFDGWGRKLEWLLKLVQYIQFAGIAGQARPGSPAQNAITAADLIAHLRDSTRTGYPDIEVMSFDLVKVAETAWLRQISAWVLYGRLPTIGATDFFISRQVVDGSEQKPNDSYRVQDSLVPCFVTPAAANSVLFVGKSINRIRDRRSFSAGASSDDIPTPDLTLLSDHLAYLSSLESPINSSSFSAAIGAIRLSLSQNVLQKFLPMAKVLEILYILKDFFLLERGEFTVALLSAADERLTSKSKTERLKPSLVNDLAGMTIKEGEVSAMLSRTWTSLSSLQSLDDEDADEELDQARELLRLSIGTLSTRESNHKLTGPAFDDLLLPSSTILSLRIPSPLDLFLTSPDVDTYSYIHSYLLAIRRAHVRLSKLFLLSVLRRKHPAPKLSTSLHQHQACEELARIRTRANNRTRIMRPIWGSIGSAALFLAEVGQYFQGEVVKGSWSTFHSWLVPTLNHDTGLMNMNNLSPIGSIGRPSSSRPISSRSIQDSAPQLLHDPETLTEAHRRYLESLKIGLLLTNTNFTTTLRRFMTSVDHISALMHRLNTVQQSLDLETDADVASVAGNLVFEEKRLTNDLKASRTNIDNGVHILIEALRTIDAARARGHGSEKAQGTREQNGFVPFGGGGIDRLLLKLDYGNA